MSEDSFEDLEELELELQSLPDMDKHFEHLDVVRSEESSETIVESATKLSLEIPEGASLRAMNLLTEPNEDDFAKYLVRLGRLGIEDVLEIVDADGFILGSKVLPHAEAKYLEEVALEESARRTRSSYYSSLGSDDLLHGVLQYDDSYDVNEGESPEEGEEDINESGETMVSGSKSESSSYAGDVGPLRNPKTVESVYNLIDPEREDDFNAQIEHFNSQIAHIQHEICSEHKLRQILKKRNFQFEKNIILDAVSEAGILYLPGNFLYPIIGRRIKDKDVPLILETVKEIPEADFKGFNLAYNQITDQGITMLAQFIQERPAIVHLNLSHNDFTATGLQTLVTCLMNRTSLQSFKITGVKVGDEGINSITCLYLCGKGAIDLDLSETDMSLPGFQAFCSALQAVDDDEDYPTFLTKYKLPFSLDTLARLKVENHEYMKAQTYTHLCHSHFELVSSSEKSKPLEETNMNWGANASETKESKPQESGLDEEITKGLKDAFDTTLSAGDFSEEEKPTTLDFTEAVVQSVRIEEKARTLLPTVEEFIHEHKMLKKSGCRAKTPDGRPVIVCPSLYSLEIDEFTDDEGSSDQKRKSQLDTIPLKVNPMHMDTLVTHSEEEEMKKHGDNRDVADTHTAEKATATFVRDAFKEAGAVAGMSDYTQDSDMTQLLLSTILENARNFLRAETPIPGGDSNELTETELKMIWEHSLKTTAKILRPAIPTQCAITDDIMGIFVEEFLKISSGMFYRLIQVPFLQDLFERAATKGCIDATKAKEIKTRENYQADLSDMPYNKIVQDIVIKFLEGVILRTADIIGGGDPFNLRHRLGGRSNNEFIGKDAWPSVVDLTEEMVEPLVEKFFEAGGILAQDALTFKEEDNINQDDGIEPAKIYLKGVFSQLANFLYQVKEDDEKMKERMDKPAKRFTFSTKPVRLVLNRPFFKGYEPVMASKMAAFLRNNDSVMCLHLRKWDLGEDGMINLMESLILNMNIVTLDLASNGIGAEGMRPLGEYIKLNQNLRHLLLNHNRLRNPGIQVLTDSIEESSLVSLNVAFNDVSEKGLYQFLQAVRKSNIYSLYILGNCFTQECCMLLKDLFESKLLKQEECDVEIKEYDGDVQLVKNSLARDINEWYEVPADVDAGLVCPPFYMELYKPPKVSIFGAVDIEL